MVVRTFTLFIILLVVFSSNAQNSLTELLSVHNSKSVPYISVQELAMPKTDAIILDAREKSEYDVSHIENAVFVGYNSFNLDEITSLLKDKSAKIVVYCSLGIRSENIAEKLQKAGYTNVYNLFGGIFEWKNNNFSVVNSIGKETDSIHAFSKPWSKWLLKGTKVYD